MNNPDNIGLSEEFFHNHNGISKKNVTTIQCLITESRLLAFFEISKEGWDAVVHFSKKYPQPAKQERYEE
jgi:hypothetical protein